LKQIIITFQSLCLAALMLGSGIPPGQPAAAYGQPLKKTGQPREEGRDPFLLPPGVRHLSQGQEGVAPVRTETGPVVTPDVQPAETAPRPLSLKAILISDHIRLATIDQQIVAVGDTINEEKILEIQKDRVILGKGDRRRTLLLSQSPIRLTIEGK